jgi:hypothetical protein
MHPVQPVQQIHPPAEAIVVVVVEVVVVVVIPVISVQDLMYNYQFTYFNFIPKAFTANQDISLDPCVPRTIPSLPGL